MGLHASGSAVAAGTLQPMAPRIQTAVIASFDPPGWLVRVVGTDEVRHFQRLEDAEAHAQSLAWTREGREQAKRLLKTQPA
jgi:hypothetical protein